MSYQDLLDKMTLAEKVGQMFMLAFSGDRMDEAQVLMEVNLVGAAYISNENVPTPEAAYNLTTTLGEYANNTRLKIPQLLGVDQEGAWSVMYPASTPGPGNMAIGATGDPQMAYRMYEVIGRELRAVGLNTLLAPCADCNANPMNAIIGMRSFGEKPGLVGIMTATAVRGAQASGVVATVKHYPGHGDTTMDSHRGLPIVDRSLDDLNAVELHPFREGVSADVGMVMTAHIIFPALDKTDPATLSAPILRGVLREQMGFDGVILSDSMNMMAMKQNYDSHEAAIRAFNAGVDVLMLAEEHYDHDAKTYLKGHQSLIQAVITAATDGTLSMARVDDAVRRILALKDRFGLQLGSPVPREEALALVGSESHRAVELEVAQGAISVLRNQHDRLPLASDQPFVLINTTTRTSYDPLGKTRGIGPNQTDAAFDLFEAALTDRGANFRTVTAERLLNGEAFTMQAGEVIVAVTENFPLPGMDFDQVSQPELVKQLHKQYGDKLIVVALRDPYELRLFPDIATYLCAFSFRKPAAIAAAGALLGAFEPRTHSSVGVAEANIEAAEL